MALLNYRLHYLLSALLGMAAFPAFAQNVNRNADVAQNNRTVPLRDADALLRAGKPADAYALLAALEQKHSGEARFNYRLGVAALDSGKLDKAVTTFKKALAEDPNIVGAHFESGRAYFQMGDLPHAKSEFVALLDANPQNVVRATAKKYLAAIDLQAPANETHARSATEEKVAQAPASDAKAGKPKDDSQASGYVDTPTLVRIDRFLVKGNTLLDPGLIERLLNPFKGNGRGFADIMAALEALEGAYRTAGYSAVHVVTPEQKITEGTITFEVIENLIVKVTLNGNRYYDKKNIRNALPGLVEGTTPSTRELSKNIQLANQNPTRQIDLVLAMGEEDNTLEAKVNVQDSSPHKFFVTLDNTGTQSTGRYRAGVGYQHNNLFNRDQALTLNYVTSPSHVKDVTQVSASYRIPLYLLGDSVDFLAAYSDTNAGTTNVAGAGAGSSSLLTFSGKGNVYGAHYNHYLPRKGDYTSRIIAGIDYRITNNNCLLANAACPATPDINLLPVTLTYGGTVSKQTYDTDYTASWIHNLPGGNKGGSGVFDVSRLGAPANYNILHVNGSVSGVLPKDWQYRVAGNAQYADALISSEKLGLAGANAVRGFMEREFSDDRGYIFNLELYTPELAPYLKMKEGSLRFLGFVDNAGGWNKPLPGELGNHTTLASVGVGFRYSSGKNLAVKFDLAKVACGDTDGVTCTASNVESRTGDMRGQISVLANW